MNLENKFCMLVYPANFTPSPLTKILGSALAPSKEMETSHCRAPVEGEGTNLAVLRPIVNTVKRLLPIPITCFTLHAP